MGAGEIVLSIPIVAIICGTILKLAKLRAAQGLPAMSKDATKRIDALEEDVRNLQRELGETQERLDFTERLLSKTREEKRVGG